MYVDIFVYFPTVAVDIDYICWSGSKNEHLLSMYTGL